MINNAGRDFVSMQKRISFGMKLGLSRAHATTLAKLRTPHMIQDFVSSLPTNFEPEGDTCWSAAETLRRGRAHCIEGAFVAACAFWLNGERPLLMDLQAVGDDDHVVALFQRGGCWGAVSKSNHIWLRWRDPVYRSPRELAMSYFHEYVWRAHKSLRRYSKPFDLSRLDPQSWVTNEDNCWDVAEALDNCRHYALINHTQSKNLRPRDKFEVGAGRLVEHEAPDKKSAMRY